MRTAFPVQELPVRSALTVAANCVNRTRKHAASVTHILSFVLVLPFSAALEACISRPRGTSRTKKGLKLLQMLGLFPISQSHKLIQNFLQSLEPPFLVGGCPSVSPVHLRAVRFTNLGYFFPKFLDALRH